jgi:hypothetical protein
MRTWLQSQTAALILSFAALLSLVFRALYDTHFILGQDYNALGNQFVLLWLVGYTAIIGGWVWAALAFAGGSLGARYALFVYALICFFFFGIASLFQFGDHLVEDIMFGVTTVSGGLAAASLLSQLGGPRGSKLPFA